MCRELRFAIAVLLAGLAARAQAATPYLVKDVNPNPDSANSSPREFAAFTGRAVFAAEKDGDRELWSSDGTETGTVRLADVCADDCSSDPRLVASTPIGAFYLLAQGSSDRELWLTRGVAGDPIRLATGLAATSAQGVWVPELRRVFFAASADAQGRELWSSDGTVAGTRLVDVRPGPYSSGLGSLVAFKGKLFFFADGDGSGYALWSSDGTADGTRLVRRPTAAGLVRPLVALERSLLFFAGAAGKGSELWRSDGTTAGTVLLLDTVKGPGSPTVFSYQSFPSKLYLVLDTPRDGQELWVTDGTQKGTHALTAFARRSAFYFLGTPLYLFPGAIGGRFVFSADDGLHGAEPWITDGSVRGTRLLRDICPGPCGSLSWIVGQAGQRLLLNATDGQRGFELWSTDGTAAGTRLVGDLCPGECDSFPLGYDAVGGRRFFLAHAEGRPEDVFDLWASDGTLAGTQRLTDLGDRPIGSLDQVVTATTMFFTSHDAQHGWELWASDGTLARTHLVRDIADEDLGGSFPTALHAAGGRLYFLADDGGSDGLQLWRSDGSEEGTALVDDGSRWQPASSYFSAAAIGTDLIFTRTDDEGIALWRTDGTEAGTIQLSPTLAGIRSMTAVGSTVFFSARDEAFEDGLWKTDGTMVGTREIMHFGSVYDGWAPSELTPFGDGVIFQAGSLEHGVEPWRSDGTAAGTSQIRELEPGEGGYAPHGFQAVGGVMYFFGPPSPAAPPGGVGLWRTDGTSAGTLLVVDVGGLSDAYGPGWIAKLGTQLLVFLPRGLWVTDGTQAGTRQISTASRYYAQPASERPAVFGGRVYFSAIDAVSQRSVLFTSDGTAEGTAPMLDRESVPIQNPSSLRVFGGRLTFTADHGGDSALWQSDGTPAGTSAIFHLGPVSNSSPHETAVAGSRLYFAAQDHDHGVELWALPAEP